MPPQEYQGGIAAKLGLKRYDADVARSIMRIMYDDSGEHPQPLPPPEKQ